MPTPPPLADIETHFDAMGAVLRAAGVPGNVVGAIRTKALRTGRKVTGEFATNRDPRWSLDINHPQYGTEIDCKIIFVKLAAQIFCFDNAPSMPTELTSDHTMKQVLLPACLTLDHRLFPNFPERSE
jgi:hypothetical protein